MPSHPNLDQDLGENMSPVGENRSLKIEQSAKPAGLRFRTLVDFPGSVFVHGGHVFSEILVKVWMAGHYRIL